MSGSRREWAARAARRAGTRQLSARLCRHALGTLLAPHSPNGSRLPFSLTQVQVELKKGKTIMTDASLHLPAAFLHETFSNRSGVPPDHFELYYRGKRLEGEAALASWGVGKDATIEVKMRGRGGMEDQKGGQVPMEAAKNRQLLDLCILCVHRALQCMMYHIIAY